MFSITFCFPFIAIFWHFFVLFDCLVCYCFPVMLWICLVNIVLSYVFILWLSCLWIYLVFLIQWIRTLCCMGIMLRSLSGKGTASFPATSLAADSNKCQPRHKKYIYRTRTGHIEMAFVSLAMSYLMVNMRLLLTMISYLEFILLLMNYPVVYLKLLFLAIINHLISLWEVLAK